MATLPKLHTIAYAAAVLDLQERQGRRLAARGDFGRLRKVTRAEAKAHGVPPHTRIVVDLGVVQRLKQAREKAVARKAAQAELARRKKVRKAKRKGRR